MGIWLNIELFWSLQIFKGPDKGGRFSNVFILDSILRHLEAVMKRDQDGPAWVVIVKF